MAGYLKAVRPEFLGCVFEVWPAPGARESLQKCGGRSGRHGRLPPQNPRAQVGGEASHLRPWVFGRETAVSTSKLDDFRGPLLETIVFGPLGDGHHSYAPMRPSLKAFADEVNSANCEIRLESHSADLREDKMINPARGGRFSPPWGPGSLGTGSGSKNNAGRITNLFRRPIIRPVRG